jgi:two-component system, NtrC family, response regulator PilR
MANPATQTRGRILLVDDDPGLLRLLSIRLRAESYDVEAVESAHAALATLNRFSPDLVITDLRMDKMDGIGLLKELQTRSPGLRVVIITAHGTIPDAVVATQSGAFGFLTKPIDKDELMVTVEKAMRVSGSSDIEEDWAAEIITRNQGMKEILQQAKMVAATDARVLITGESGTGKELIARAIHDQSGRADKPFVPINCGGIPETLVESEFFGHKKGSFTGASQDKKGLLEAAHGGTVFLDEVGELSISMQVKLLRAVQERVFRCVGGTQDIAVDIRIVSATNKKLEDEVIAGNFREDLFYRLNVIEIKVPPLRERKGDLKLLAQHFIEKYAREMGKEVTKLSSYAIDLLKKYNFPGNVRELENLIERSVALSSTNILLPDSLAMSIHKRRWIEGIQNKRYDLDEVANGVALDTILSEIERSYITKSLECTNGNKNKAAELLGITFRSFRYRVDKLDIDSQRIDDQ